MNISRQHFIKMVINIAVLTCTSGMIKACGSNSQLELNKPSNKNVTGANMIKPAQISSDFKNHLVMKYSPVGFYFTDQTPEGAASIKNPVRCIMPRILASAKGKINAFDEKSLPNCAAFFLGFRNKIFTGVEYFLSHAPLAGSHCERFVKTPRLARKYIKSKKFAEKSKGVAVFKPLEQFTNSEKPEIFIFFANPDQLSGLVYLLYFGAPLDDDRVVAGFSSGCGSVVNLPLQYGRKGLKKAVWELHDVSARAVLPAELMTLTLQFDLLVEIWKDIKESFLMTETWDKIIRRITKNNNKMQVGKNEKSNYINSHSTDAEYKKCDACH